MDRAGPCRDVQLHARTIAIDRTSIIRVKARRVRPDLQNGPLGRLNVARGRQNKWRS